MDGTMMFTRKSDAIETAQYLSRKKGNTYIVVERWLRTTDYRTGQEISWGGYQVIPSPVIPGKVTTGIEGHGDMIIRWGDDL